MAIAAPKQQRSTPVGFVLGDLPEMVVQTLFALAWAFLCQPVLSVPLTVGAAVGYVLWTFVGLQGAVLAGGALLLAPCAWRIVHPSSFERLARSRLRNTRARLRYGRRWRAVMLGCQLGRRHVDQNGKPQLLVPRLKRVVVGEYRDEVLVKLLPGQTPGDYQGCCDALAEQFGDGVLWVRSRTERRGFVWLDFQHIDPLADVIPALPIPTVTDLGRVQVGLLEDGSPWTVRVLGSHLLLIGASRAGKSSFLAALIRDMGSAIRDGLVELHGIDPKGGMEFGTMEELFTTFVYGTDVDAAIKLLAQLNTRQMKRAELMRKAHRRTHVPTGTEPLIVCVIDELIALYAAASRAEKPKLELGIRKLQVMGAACGITMIAAGQNPEKKLIDNRDEFTVRVGFRTNASSHPDMIFFDGARAAGARCDEISDDPTSGRGIAYTIAEGVAGFRRGRVAYCSTPVIRRMAIDYSPRVAAPAAHLKAVIEGEGSQHVPMTPEQFEEFEACRARLETEGDVQAEGEVV